MPSKILIHLILLGFAIQPRCEGQGLYYTPLLPNGNYRIAGEIGNHFHLWKFQKAPGRKNKKRPAISILVFSAQMQFISETPIFLEDDNVFQIEVVFQFDEYQYKAYIKYYDEYNVPKRFLATIDEHGSLLAYSPYENDPYLMVSINNIPGKAARNFLKVDPKNNGSFYYAWSSMLGPDSNAATPEESRKMVLLPRNSLFIQKIRIRDISRFLISEFHSYQFDFDIPIVEVEGNNSIWVCASQQPDALKNRQDTAGLNSLFLVKLDSNLKEITNSRKYFPANAPDFRKKIYYRLEHASAIDKKLILVSMGNHPTIVYYAYNTLYHRIFYYRQGIEAYETKSIRILKMDDTGKCLLDTLFSTNILNTQLEASNSYYAHSGDQIDMLFPQQFPHRMNGIKYYRVTSSEVDETDIQANPKFSYLVSETRMLKTGLFIIPFTRKGKFGFLKWLPAPTHP